MQYCIKLAWTFECNAFLGLLPPAWGQKVSAGIEGISIIVGTIVGLPFHVPCLYALIKYASATYFFTQKWQVFGKLCAWRHA